MEERLLVNDNRSDAESARESKRQETGARVRFSGNYEELNDDKARSHAGGISVQSPSEAPEVNYEDDPKNATMILFTAYSVFFSRYCVATALSSFFPQEAEQIGIGSTMLGIIFASYPAGIAITSILAPKFILSTGTRTVISASLVLTSTCSLIFGFAPDLCSKLNLSDKNTTWFFLFMYFLNGLFGGFAECGTTILLGFEFKHRLGAVTAMIGTVCGLGCMAGPTVGGLIYGIGDVGPLQKFSLPFIFLSVLEFCLAFLCLFYFTEFRKEEEDPNSAQGKKAEEKSILTPSRILTLGAIALSGTIVAALDPTLAYRLSDDPFNYSASMVGVVFMISSVAYTATSVPVGWAIDQLPYDRLIYCSTQCKRIQALGFFLLFICFAMLGPFAYPSDWEFFDNIPCGYIAMIIKGLGSSGNNAGYPDLIIGLSENDEMLQARVSGLWNASYAFGWALGPFMGGILYDALEFDGFASIISIISLVYACVLIIASQVSDLGVKDHTPEELDKYEGKSISTVHTNVSRSTHRSKR